MQRWLAGSVVGILQLSVNLTFGITDGMHHTGERCEADISATIRNYRIVGFNPDSLASFGAFPLGVVNARCYSGLL
jgi:hypothetical protein